MMKFALILVAIICIVLTLGNVIATNNVKELKYSATLAWLTILIMDIIILFAYIHGN